MEKQNQHTENASVLQAKAEKLNGPSRQEQGTPRTNLPTKRPLVSVIVPIYNAQKHIARCLESIRHQSYQNLEILLLNDGSQDVSYQVCQMYANVDSRIVLIDKANSGVAATRNLGLRYAAGTYLQFVDADDWLEPDATEQMVEKAEQYSADLVIAHYNRITPPKEPPHRPGEPLLQENLNDEKPAQAEFRTFGFLPEGFMEKNEFACGLMQEPASFYYGVMWNKLYRAAVVHEHADVVCSEELNWSEDLYFNLSFIRYANRFYSLATPVYNYLNNPESACHTVLNPLNVMATKASLFAYYKALYEQLGLYEENRLQIFKYLVSSAEN